MQEDQNTSLIEIDGITEKIGKKLIDSNIKTVLIPQLQKDKLHYKSLLKDESLSLDKQLEYKDKINSIRHLT